MKNGLEIEWWSEEERTEKVVARGGFRLAGVSSGCEDIPSANSEGNDVVGSEDAEMDVIVKPVETVTSNVDTRRGQDSPLYLFFALMSDLRR